MHGMVLVLWGSLSYSGEWVWNLRTKLCWIALGMWSRVSLKELAISYIIIYNNFTERVKKVSEWLANQVTVQVNEVRSQIRENVFLLLNSDIMNLLLNTNGGRNRKPNFVIFVDWYTLIVGGWVLVGVLVAWSRKSCLGPAEIVSFMSVVLFKNAGCKMSPRFHIFVSDVNQENKTLTSRSFYLKWERHFK